MKKKLLAILLLLSLVGVVVSLRTRYKRHLEAELWAAATDDLN